jgi:hypothetical protein
MTLIINGDDIKQSRMILVPGQPAVATSFSLRTR